MQMKGVELVKLNRLFPDERGFFIEIFKASTWPEMKQVNSSFSHTNVVRGFHYQKGEHAQQKTVQVLSGKILDVVLDIRPGSPTFGEIYKIELTAGNGALKIDSDLAHGFWALEPSIVVYHCDKEYAPQFEGCINPMSEGLDIPWLHQSDLIISEKDKNGQTWREYETSVINGIVI